MVKPCNACKYSQKIKLTKRYRTCCSLNKETICEKYQKYNRYLENQRMYKSGGLFYSLDEIMQTDIVWFNNKPMPTAFLIGMPFRVVVNLLKAGVLRKVERR